ncbi:basic leucine zipper 19 isoform X2 [Gossypium hirsutum]|uniref:Basic leucine zipper 19 isoform X2 n=2 Tax=Gossypium TaxID=3633 RepID=A0A1U8PDF5_GOSHI|nr:basic leucine zipper 19-like isoform X2 [Gossypium hirsutum]TYI44882.1 hypothetical protein ES332_A01G269000v1 [Gossypium tomentosum]
MDPKNETSPNAADNQMLNPNAENEDLTLPLESIQPLHKRSASDSLAFVKEPYWHAPSSSAQGRLLGGAAGSSSASHMDPKKLKRLIANRASAQKSRLRRVEYVDKLEKKAEFLEATASLVSPRVTSERKKRMMLLKENAELKQKIEFYDKLLEKQDGEAAMLNIKH